MYYSIFALAAAVVGFLHGFGVLDDTTEVRWLPIALGLLALHFCVGVVVDRHRG